MLLLFHVIKNFGDDLRERWVFPARAEDIGYGSGKKVVPRYVANTFVERVYGLLVANFNEDFLGKEKKNWKGNILDWPEHQRYIEKRTDSEEMQKKFFPLFEWKLVRKYGMDEMPAGLAAEPDREQKKLTPFEVMMAEAEKENPKLETFAEQVGA